MIEVIMIKISCILIYIIYIVYINIQHIYIYVCILDASRGNPI